MDTKRRKEGAPEIPVEMDGLIWAFIGGAHLRGENLSDAARALEIWLCAPIEDKDHPHYGLPHGVQFWSSNAASAELNLRAHAMSMVECERNPAKEIKLGLYEPGLRPGAKAYERAMRAGHKPRQWGWKAILKRYYKLRDERTQAGRRARRHMAP